MAMRDILNKTYYGELQAGEHKVLLVKANLMLNNEDSKKDYFRFEFQIGERPFVKNMFDNDFTYFLSHTRKQFGRDNEAIVPETYIKELIDNKTEFSIWIDYPTVQTFNGLRRVQNVHFLAPLAKAEVVETKADPNFKEIE